MNSHVIASDKIAKIKKLNRQIGALKELSAMFGFIGGLTTDQQIKLRKKETKLNKLINEL
jgi:hypothetical protein